MALLSGTNQPLLARPITTVDVNFAFLPPPEIVKAIEKAGIIKVFFLTWLWFYNLSKGKFTSC